MIRSLSLRSRWATASTRASAAELALALRRRAVVLAELVDRPERALVERVERELLERPLVERPVLLERELVDLERELVDERPVLLDLEVPLPLRPPPPLERDPEPPLLACGI